jgi:sugar (pentulose or hexulose) kinase
MSKIPVILIFDVGKTNKKILLFNEQYRIVHEESKPFEEITDEDGFPCEDIHRLTQWLHHSFERLSADARFLIKAVNFSAYGASFVYLNEQSDPFLPLYNYLKPYPEDLQRRFYRDYGGENELSRQTASPVLGNLNSGLQLYRLKYQKPESFSHIKYALHLPQYLCYVLSAKAVAEITSIGCHTHLWDFEKKDYHTWVSQENIEKKFPPIVKSESIAGISAIGSPVGTGLHDSSAALIPYLASFHEPFILLSTGTWCISLNPFNHTPLSGDELRQDCLCYLSYKGDPVKASRLFAGHEHEQQVKRLAVHFLKDNDYYANVSYDRSIVNYLTGRYNTVKANSPSDTCIFADRELCEFGSFDEAYHQLIMDIVQQQLVSTALVLEGTSAKRIFVDGGFGKNQVYMHLLAEAFPGIEVYAASVPQASAIGAAMAIHEKWNSQSLPSDIIQLKVFPVQEKADR